jgi:sarcosine oxidase
VVARFDVVVIGAGAIGSATAWWLAREGRSVLLAERFEPGHARGSSHGAVRIFRFAYNDPELVAMAMQALPLWRELEDDCGEVLVEQSGAVDHGPPDVIDRIVAALRECGVRHERMHGAAMSERFAGLRFDDAAVFHPDGGRTFADRTVSALQRRAADHGADVRFGCPTRVVATGPDDVELDAGGETVRADRVVVAAGPWAADVLASAGAGALPALSVTQEHVVHFRPLDESLVWPSFIHHRPAGEQARYGLPSVDEGLKVGVHHGGPEVTGDTQLAELDAEQVDRIVDYAGDWIPGVVPEPQFGATCLYTTTPDERFVVERRGPIVIGSACSGHGFKFTPLTGRRLARLAIER